MSWLQTASDDPRDPRWRRGAIRFAAVAAALVLALFGFLVHVLLASGDADYWAGEIAAFERADISNPPPRGAIVFAGGTTFRRWDGLAAAMAPLPVINRGFGGAHVAHVAAYAPRIIAPYEPSAVVISAGADDLADVGGKPPENVAADMAALINAVRPGGEGPPVYVLAITPAPMRAARWPALAEANGKLAALAAAREGVTFIDIAAPLFAADGRLREAFYRWDGLSFSRAGYEAIGSVIRARLMADLSVPVAPVSAPPGAPAP